MNVTLATILLAVAVCTPCLADSQLSVRLVEAVPQGDQRSGEGLEDVIEILKKSLAVADYRLVDSCTITLPAGGSQTLGDYTIKCTGTRKNLAVNVFRGDREIVRSTNVPLHRDKPFILGGLPGRSGKMLLVFLVK